MRIAPCPPMLDGMGLGLKLHPALKDDVREALQRRPLEEYWREGEPLRGGRGTARTLSVCGFPVLIKKESRGGLARRLLPDSYLLRGPFEREWAVGLHLAEMDLSPQPVAQAMVSCGPFFAVYTMTALLTHAFPLVQLWREGRLGQPVLKAVGKGVGCLHRAGVLHGDLNAGNVLVVPGPWVYFLDLRHSPRREAPPSAGEREGNFLRLSRSLHKNQILYALTWPKQIWESLAEGYGSGWGMREEWLSGWAADSLRGFPLRSLAWKRSVGRPGPAFPTSSGL